MSRKARAVSEKDLYRDKPNNPNKKLKFSVPIPPSVNHMYVRLPRGGVRLRKSAEEYVTKSRALINLAIDEQKWIKQEYATWLYVDLVFYMPDRKIRDSHNCIKILLDVMQEVVFDNDYFVMPRVQSVEYDKENPRLEVVVTAQTRDSRIKGLKTTAIGL